MRARYYNQDIKRFINRDVVSGDITNSQSLNRYCYVQGNPVSLIDPFGLCPTEEERKSIEFKRKLSQAVHGALDGVGLLVPGMGDMLDAVNAIIYALEGDIDMAIISLICTIPIVGSLIGLPIKYAMRCGVDIGMAFMKFGIRNAPEITKGVSRLARAMKSKYDDASAWVSKKFAKFTPDSGRIPESGRGSSDSNLRKILNVGAGDSPIPCATNIDINPSALGVIFGDANDLSQFASGQFDHVIALNPYNYNLLDSDVPRVLKEGGIMSVTGNYSNKYFKAIYNASPEALRQAGFEVVSRGDAGSAFLKYGGKVTGGVRQTKGTPLQIILRKVGTQ